ncbi:MAG: zinc-dependent alcohol dehydrogenase family protein [Francisellaceae bacterium]
MAKIVQFNQFGGPEVLHINDIQLGNPGENEVKLRINAIGLNRAETMLREDNYIVSAEFPSKLGYDASGEVIAVGRDVKSVSVGDKVFTIPAFSQSKNGVYGEEAIVPANACWLYPNTLSDIEAACVGTNYTTAYFGLKYLGQLCANDYILITAATGGVGFAAIEIAKDMDATVIATTRNPNKVQDLLNAGADHVILTSQDSLSEKIASITSGRGVKIVFDAIAGAMIPLGIKCLTPGGKYVLYGIMDHTSFQIEPLSLLKNGLSILSHAVVFFTGYPDLGLPQNNQAIEDAKAYILPRLASGKFKPKVSQIFKLDDVREAQLALQSDVQIGKIIMTTR